MFQFARIRRSLLCCLFGLTGLTACGQGPAAEADDAVSGQFEKPLIAHQADAVRLPEPKTGDKYASALDFLRKMEVDTPAVPLKLDPATYKSSHPRLPILEGEAMERFRRNTSVFNTYVGYAKAVVNPSAFNSLRNTSALLMVALATGDPGYFESVKQVLESPLPNYSTFQKIYFTAYAYDWFYDRFTEDEKVKYRDIVFDHLLRLEHDMVSTQPSPFNDVGPNRFEAGLLTAAIVLFPDHPKGQEHLEFALAYHNDQLEVMRQIMGRTGGWHEGTDYYNIGISKVIPRMLWEWRTASGQDLFKANPWIEGAIFFCIYKMRPDATPSRSSDVNLAYIVADNAIWPLSIEYRNPYGLWFARRMTQNVANAIGVERKPNGIDPSMYPWGYPDLPDMAEAAPADLPQGWLFEGTGEAVLRSGWTEDDTVVEFKAGPSYWSHCDQDHGSFTIYRRGALAINSGVYYYAGDDHHLNYRRQAISKNAILVYDPADTFTTKLGKPLANDGGQRRVDGYFGVDAPSIYDYPLAQAFQAWTSFGRLTSIPMPAARSSLKQWKEQADTFLMGRITAFDSRKEFGFVSADLTRAYTNEQTGGDPIHRTRRVREWKRLLLFAGYKYVVLFDEVSSLNADFPKRWLLHTINEPVVNGTEVSALRTEQVTSNYSFAFGLKYASSNRRQYQYNGKLQMRNLLPADAQISKVGGPGREFEVEGKNYDATPAQDTWRAPGGKISTDSQKGPQEPGAWRIEISPAAPAEDDVFLNVLYPTDASGPALPATAPLAGEGYRGLTLEDPAQPWAILFAGKDWPESGLSYSIQMNRETMHWIGCLPAGRYRLLRGEDPVGGEAAVGADGVLAVKGPGSGTFRVVRLSDSQPAQ